eukprot:TRINITY_DN6774_c0_g1_i1.p1 TRINITY_DN6774_c0_g1~~TRINITY_DN6774_c0_g1_i1.p1  ORF type:complete len:864 (-),score=150.67 TRINITY_DN6774_c0_g1_i1:179-2770(-)
MLHQLVSSPPEQHLFTLNLYNEWKKVSEALLKNLVFVSRRAKRAKCKVNLSDFETVTDLSIVEGRDLLVPGWESRGPNLWCWEPGHNQCLETHEILWAPELSILKALAFEPFRDQASQATPEQEPPLQVASQTDPIMPEITEMTTQITQTDPLMRVRVGDRRQAPLDLVICVDSSASLCMSKEALPTYHSEGGAFVSSGAFESVKGLLEYLAHAMHMPEVRLGLVRFEDSPQVICPLTGQRDTFLSHLRCMKMSTGETRLAPALHLALQMLEDERKCVRANRADWELPREEKAIVVITDGDANDMAQSMEMATVVKEKDCQLLFIKMGAEQDNLHQMSHAPRRVHSLHKGGAAEYAGTARGVFHSATTNLQDLVSLVPDIQRQLLRSARRIEQARCTLQLGFHEVVVVEDLSHTTGHDVLLENDPAPLLLDHTPWVHTESFAYGTRHEITIKRDELQEAKEICTTLRANFVQTDLTDAKERELEHVKRVLVQRADDIRRLNEELQTLKDGISQRDNTIHRLRDEIGSFQTMPREDDSRISSLKSSLHHAEEELDKMRSEARIMRNTLQETRETSEAKLHHAEEELDKMRSEARIMRNTLQETRETSEAKLHHAEEELDKMRSEARIMRNTLQETREASEARQHEVQRLQTKIDHLSLKEEKANSRERSRDWLQEVEQLRTSLREVTNQKIKEEQLHNLTKQRLEEERSQNKEIQSVVDKLMAFLCTAMQHPQSTLELQQQQPRQRPQSARPGGRPSSAHEGARIELNQLRARLEAHHGDLVRAFHDIDDNRTGEITATEMIKGLGTLGLTRSEAQLAFRRLCSLSNSQRKGSLKLSSWLGAFDAKHAASGSLQASLELPGSIG